jgi:hypothetical protein
LSTAWHFGQSGTIRAPVVEGSTRIGVRRASFIRCFQVTYSGWAEILLKAELSKPHGRLDGSLTKSTGDRGRHGLYRCPAKLGKPSGVGPTAPTPARTGKLRGSCGSNLRKQLQFERFSTLESIADRLVFNRTVSGSCVEKEPQAVRWTHYFLAAVGAFEA